MGKQDEKSFTALMIEQGVLLRFITWYNAKPAIERSKDGIITITYIHEFMKFDNSELPTP